MTLARLQRFFLPSPGVLLLRPYAIVVSAAVAVATIVALSDVGQRFEWTLYDRFARIDAARQPAPAPGIVVVAIDEPSFAQIGMAWPWPRSLHAAVLEQVVKGGAQSVAFDLLFDAPAASPEDDAEFADAIRRARTVILAADQSVTEDRGYAITQWIDPIASLAESAAGTGIIRIPYDPDGVLRRALFVYDGRPSFAAAIAAAATGSSGTQRIDDSRPQLFRFNGLPRRGVQTVSYYQALDAANALPVDVFEGKHVLIGRSLDATTIDEVEDHFQTPVAVRMPGVEVHATILDALLRNRFIADPFASREAMVALCVAAGAATGVILFVLGPLASPVAAIVVVAFLLAASYAMFMSSVHVPVVGPSLTVLVVYALTGAYKYGLAARDRRTIKRAFQHYVSPAIVERMLADPSQLKLGGEEYEVTVLFSDLEGFTSFAEHLTPPQLSARLGEYFKEMLGVLLPHDGTLDKLIGDAIMMYFGCPIRNANHPIDACRGALAMQARMRTLNARWAEQGLPPLRTRIGINSGMVVAGNMGTDTIFNFTVIGDAVNLASRLEGVNVEYGTRIILGEATWALVHGHFETRELDLIRVKGKTKPVAIFELIAERGELTETTREVLAHFGSGLQLYRAGKWADARESFCRALELDDSDTPSRIFSARCEALLTHPPDGWDGVYVMRTK